MECSQAAAGFETALAKVSTLADTSVVSMDTIKAQLVSLSGETGVAVESLAEATYQALSAGVDTANVVEFRLYRDKAIRRGIYGVRDRR